MILSQVLTLYTTPVVFVVMDRLRTMVMRRRKPKAPPVAKPTFEAA